MPTTKANGINIYYEIHGKGEPIAMIGGLGTDIKDYRNTIGKLSQKYMVLAFDNRGVGRTDKPDIPYTIEMMADDLAGLLENLNIKSAHIVGVSLGGRIAMALALRHPDKVKSLVLTSTFASQPKKKLPFRYNVFKFLEASTRPFRKNVQPYYAFMRQLEASRTFECSASLDKITAPTIILHGKKDKIAPYYLAEELHAGIKGSRMVTFKGGHMFSFFENQRYTGAILEFLAGIK